MSAEPALMPEEPPMEADTLESDEEHREPGEEGGAPDQSIAPDAAFDDDEPLDAEEATVLVVSFLRRMNKRVITPRKAVLNGEAFVVEVELKDATAIVNINAENREIVEYTITPKEPEPKPLPIEPKKLLRILAGAVAVIIFVMMFTFFRVYTADIINGLRYINTDYLIIGGALAGLAGIVIWWRRRAG